MSAPQKILALTFSNRAKDNLRTRLRRVIGVRYWDRVTVTNFHGFARRLILAHGNSIGLDSDLIMPQRGWQRQARAENGITWRIADRVDRNLFRAKSAPRSDEEVIAYLRTTGDMDALRFEKCLRREKRIDFNDLLRYADLILSQRSIAHLYSCHFPVVLVDELQDLTPQQLRIATVVCGGGLTAAGDEAQGIYTFAGAAPQHVFGRIADLNPAEITFRLSYRSAPRVLDAVNVIARMLDAPELECANPADWPGQGHVVTLVSDTRTDEAQVLLGWIKQRLHVNPQTSIGVIVRQKATAIPFCRASEDAGLDIEIWADVTHNAQVVDLLRRRIGRAEREAQTTHDRINALSELCRAEIEPDDIELLDDLDTISRGDRYFS